MNLISECRCSRHLASHYSPLFQFPRASRIRHISSSSRKLSTTPSETPNSSPSHPRPNKPLTPAQRSFLNSAVRPSLLPPSATPVLNSRPAVACQPSRRARRNAHICQPDAASRELTPSPAATDEAHVRPRSRAFQDFQPAASEAPCAAHRHVSRVDAGGVGAGLGHGNHGEGGRDGMYRGGGDGDRNTL